ncbi:MAG: hypothetical protein WAM92_04465 [Mycobacterium sp.]
MVTSAAFGCFSVAAIALAAGAPAASPGMVGSVAQVQPSVFVNDPVDPNGCTDANSQDCNPGDPAGGTGDTPGPQTEPDVATGPGMDQPAGSTGLDSGPAMPDDVQTDPGLADGGEPAGGIG